MPTIDAAVTPIADEASTVADDVIVAELISCTGGSEGLRSGYDTAGTAGLESGRGSVRRQMFDESGLF